MRKDTSAGESTAPRIHELVYPKKGYWGSRCDKLLFMHKKAGIQLHSCILFAAGVLLRLFYCLGTTIYERQYDISEMDLAAGYNGGGGHLGYIHYIYTYGHIPREGLKEIYQFSHPPLHYVLSAAWMRFCSLFIRDPERLAESIQVIPFVCSVAALCAIFMILSEIREIWGEGESRAALPPRNAGAPAGDGRSAAGLILAEAVFAFHPSLILLSGSVNNDGGSFLASVLCILFTLRWLRRPSFAGITELALALGLGMMTKQSVAEMAFPIAAVFLIVLVRAVRGAGNLQGSGKIREQEATGAEMPGLPSLIGQYALFLAVSVPLGMWFYLRGLMVYDMPLVFVHTLPEDSWQYIGNVPVLNRYLWPVIPEFLDNLRHFRIGCGYNVWLQIMRTSVLGEWDMAEVSRGVKVLAMLLMFAGAVLALLVFPVFVRVFFSFRDCGKRAAAAFFAVGYVIHMALYFRFSYSYPQQCSMNFRYITVTLIFNAAALAAAGGRKYRALTAVTAVFCALSAAMTAYWSFC